MSNACASDWDATLAGLWEVLQDKTRELTVGQLQEQADDATAASCNVQVNTNDSLPTCSSTAAPCFASCLLAALTLRLCMTSTLLLCACPVLCPLSGSRSA